MINKIYILLFLVSPFILVAQDPCNIYGKIKIVDSFEDYSVKIVDSFEDFTIRFVDSFEGCD